MKTKITVVTLLSISLILTLLTVYALLPLQSSVAAQAPPVPLNPLTIPKFTNQLTGPPPVYVPTDVYDGGNLVRQDYSIHMAEKMQQILPTVDALGNPTGFAQTKVWGYGGQAVDAVTGLPITADGYVLNSPGPTFEVTKGLPIRVTWNNDITTPQQFAVDPTLMWADPAGIGMPPAKSWPIPAPVPIDGYDGQSPVALVPHLHGGEVPPTSDGGPDAWWTSSGIQGKGFSSVVTPPADANWAVYDYPNINPASTLWYHDHALGITRLNVMSGLAGFYIVRDTTDATEAALKLAGITGKYDMPLVFQDRSFFTDGSFNMPNLGVQPDIHPYWIPEFFGDTIMVNGLVWPNMNVDRGTYRFRLLDGSNARFYTIQFIVNPGTVTERVLLFTQIATDGGYLTAPLQGLNKLTFAPGERVEILVDFSGLQDGDKVLIKNTAKENFPAGLRPDPKTVGQIMQFTVVGPTDPAQTSPTLPAPLNPTLPVFPTLPLANVRVTRVLTLVEVLNPVTGVPLELLMDGQKWDSPVTEEVTVGDTEEWWVINPTADSHPIHLHLVQFQVISRQKIDVAKYYPDWILANGGAEPPFNNPTVTINPFNYIKSNEKLPDPSEMGWKDTVMMHPGELTKIRIRFAPVDAPISGPGSPVAGVNPYDPVFDPTVPHGPGDPWPQVSYGYVWHCHIIDHEDNEMMRPLQLTTTVIPAVPAYTPPPKVKPPK